MPKRIRLVKTKFTSINEQLDKEHQDILDAIDNLYKACKIHWKTEKDLFERGLREMPSGHDNIKKDIKEHQATHVCCLNKIATMKKDILKHINTEDAVHFHWL
jgi:hemerythrin